MESLELDTIYPVRDFGEIFEESSLCHRVGGLRICLLRRSARVKIGCREAQVFLGSRQSS